MVGKRIGAGFLVVGGAVAVYFAVLRDWHLHWGATAQEASGEAAGDDLMPNANIVATRVVEIDAPPSAICADGRKSLVGGRFAPWPRGLKG